MLTDYACSIGVTEADAHTTRNIHLSVADCKHIKYMLEKSGHVTQDEDARQWNRSLIDYLKTAV